MKGASDLVNGLLHLRIAKHYWDDYRRELKSTPGANLLRNYVNRIDWIYNDLITYPLFTEEIRQGIKKEWNSDTFVVPAVMDKLAFLNPEQRLIIENIMDLMIAGEQIELISNVTESVDGE